MDYSEYDADYLFLVANFKNISNILTAKIHALRSAGFRDSKSYYFGFSIGARIIVQAGIDSGSGKLPRADSKL